MPPLEVELKLTETKSCTGAKPHIPAGWDKIPKYYSFKFTKGGRRVLDGSPVSTALVRSPIPGLAMQLSIAIVFPSTDKSNLKLRPKPPKV